MRFSHSLTCRLGLHHLGLQMKRHSCSSHHEMFATCSFVVTAGDQTLTIVIRCSLASPQAS